MNCPACNEPLIVLEHDAVEIDYCCSCRGIWLDHAELALLFDDPYKVTAFLDTLVPDTTGNERPRNCPICRTKMDKVATPGTVTILLDRCGRGHGVWLDDGELGRVLVLENSASSVGAFLNSIFSSRTTSAEKSSS